MIFVPFALLAIVFGFMHCQGWVRAWLEGPLRDLYFRGPRIQGYGFWNGLPVTDICAQLTHTSADVWGQNLAQCVVITDRYFEAFYIGCYTLLYMFLVYNLLSNLTQLSLMYYQYRLFCQAMQVQNGAGGTSAIIKK